MRGFILAAGFGTRLRPITDHIPKALVPLAGKPLLQHAIDFLHDHGITSIAANTHYLADKITEFRSMSGEEFAIFNESPDIRGTGGAIDFARSFLAGEDTFMIINADIVARFDLSHHIRHFEQSSDSCRLLAFSTTSQNGTVRYMPDTFQYCGTFQDASGSDETLPADFIGMAMYRKEFLTLVEPDDFSVLPVWKRAVDRGMSVSVSLIQNGFWRDIGTPKSLALAHFDIIDGTLNLQPPNGCVIDRMRKVCIPAQWAAVPERLGMYCWIEDSSFPVVEPVERTVVLKGAEEIKMNRSPHSQLLTPWGAFSFDE